MSSLDGLRIDDLVVTEKMDGENTTIHSKDTYARSHDSRYHPSRDWLKAFAVGISPQLADNERIVGENLYAQYSIGYDAFQSYFLDFAWIVENDIQPWDATIIRFEELGITPVKIIYRGQFA